MKGKRTEAERRFPSARYRRSTRTRKYIRDFIGMGNRLVGWKGSMRRFCEKLGWENNVVCAGWKGGGIMELVLLILLLPFAVLYELLKSEPWRGGRGSRRRRHRR